MNPLQFTFGKYKGEYIDDVPSTYLLWCIDNADLPYELDAAIREELVSRYAGRTAQIENNQVKNIYRELCKKYHPDKGGSDTAMQAINEFYQSLNGK